MKNYNVGIDGFPRVNDKNTKPGPAELRDAKENNSAELVKELHKKNTKNKDLNNLKDFLEWAQTPEGKKYMERRAEYAKKANELNNRLQEIYAKRKEEGKYPELTKEEETQLLQEYSIVFDRYVEDYGKRNTLYSMYRDVNQKNENNINIKF